MTSQGMCGSNQIIRIFSLIESLQQQVMNVTHYFIQSFFNYILIGNSESRTHSELGAAMTPTTPKSLAKPPKRVDVITLSSPDARASSFFRSETPKHPKRVTVTTLQTFDKLSPDKPGNSPDDKVSLIKVVEDVPNSKTVAQTSTSVTPTSSHKAPKRISVTTLCTFEEKSSTTMLSSNEHSTCQIQTLDADKRNGGPIEKKPKRVPVTTLCEFGDSKEKTENTATSSSDKKN